MLPQPGDIVVGMPNRGRTLVVRVGQVIAVVLTIPTANGIFVSSSDPRFAVQPSPAPVTSGPEPQVLTKIGTGRFRATFPGTAMLLAIRDCTLGECPSAWGLEVTVRP